MGLKFGRVIFRWLGAQNLWLFTRYKRNTKNPQITHNQQCRGMYNLNRTTDWWVWKSAKGGAGCRETDEGRMGLEKADFNVDVLENGSSNKSIIKMPYFIISEPTECSNFLDWDIFLCFLVYERAISSVKFLVTAILGNWSDVAREGDTLIGYVYM